jgi:hypothetical protein
MDLILKTTPDFPPDRQTVTHFRNKQPTSDLSGADVIIGLLELIDEKTLFSAPRVLVPPPTSVFKMVEPGEDGVWS